MAQSFCALVAIGGSMGADIAASFAAHGCAAPIVNSRRAVAHYFRIA